MHFICWGVRSPPQTPPLSVNAFCIVTNSAHETPVYPYIFIRSNTSRTNNFAIIATACRTNSISLEEMSVTHPSSSGVPLKDAWARTAVHGHARRRKVTQTQ